MVWALAVLQELTVMILILQYISEQLVVENVILDQHMIIHVHAQEAVTHDRHHQQVVVVEEVAAEQVELQVL